MALESERRDEWEFVDFAENASLSMHWVGLDGTILWANPAELALLGYTRDEYVGHFIAEFHADKDVAEDILTRLSRGETLREYPARLRCKDGSIRHVLIDSSVLWDDGRFVRTRCITRDVTDRLLAEQRLAVQYAVVRMLAESATLDDASSQILQTIGDVLSWHAGVLWIVDRRAGVLRCVAVWHQPSVEIGELEAVCRGRTFEPGVGLAGRVWASGRPVWIANALEDDNVPRAPHAARADLHAAFGFPICLGEDVLGVIEFFSREVRAPDDGLLAMMAAVGGQIGQFIERRRAEEERSQFLDLERAARREAQEQAANYARLNRTLREVADERTHALAERMRYEQDLRESEERLRFALEAGRMGTWDWSVATGKLVWSPNMEAVHGLPPGSFTGAFEDFERDIYPDDREEVLATIARTLESGEDYRVEYRTEWPDGSLHYLEARGRVFRDEQGAPVRMSGVCADVTERKRIEAERSRLFEHERAAWSDAQRAAQRTRHLQEITAQLSESLEADRVLATVARSAAELLEVAVGAVFLLEPGDQNSDFVLSAAHGIDEERGAALRLPRHASLAGRAVDEGRTLVVDDVRETPGTALPMLLTGQTVGAEIAAPITAGDARLGVVKAFSPTVRAFSPDDAALLSTLAAAAAVALTNARLYRQAQDAVRTRDDFLAAATHDLKSPLTSIKGMAQLLRRQAARSEGAGTARLMDGLATIDATATKMAHQLDELLDLTRLQIGQRLEMHLGPVDLVELTRRVAAEQQQSTERHYIRIEASMPELIGTWDSVRLGRVLDNLLANAIKYSPDGGDVVVSVHCEESPEGPQAVLAVRDEGLGIPAADRSRIFERFQRASNVVGRIGGTGIGLASARQIVEQHGGTIAVESHEGEGSTFTVRLPLEPDPAADTTASAERAAPPGA